MVWIQSTIGNMFFVPTYTSVWSQNISQEILLKDYRYARLYGANATKDLCQRYKGPQKRKLFSATVEFIPKRLPGYSTLQLSRTIFHVFTVLNSIHLQICIYSIKLYKRWTARPKIKIESFIKRIETDCHNMTAICGTTEFSKWIISLATQDSILVTHNSNSANSLYHHFYYQPIYSTNITIIKCDWCIIF